MWCGSHFLSGSPHWRQIDSSGAFHDTFLTQIFWVHDLLRYQNRPSSQNFRSESQKNLATPSLRSDMAHFTEWKLCMVPIISHLICSTPSCTCVVWVLPCTNYHVLCCYALVRATVLKTTTDASVLLFRLTNGTLSTPMWRHSSLGIPTSRVNETQH